MATHLILATNQLKNQPTPFSAPNLKPCLEPRPTPAFFTTDHDDPRVLSLILTALLCASSSSTLASCMTAPPTFLSPSAVRFELVMCLTKDPRLTPEYCLA